MTTTARTLTCQDIADLARVQRPVVSMWRNRPGAGGTLRPFPEPVETSGGVARFDSAAVVDWLEATGRGNNPEARLDAPALSVPSGAALEELVTLLCLRVASGEELDGTTARHRAALAKDIDPGDEYLRREVTAAAPTDGILPYVDDLVEACHGGAEALERLERGRAARAIGARDLTPAALRLLRTVCAAAALHLDPEGVPLVHAGGPATATLAVADAFTYLAVAGDRPDSRALRRRAAIREIASSATVPTSGVRLLSVVGAGADDALAALDETVLDLDSGTVAVVLGTAATLCDELRGDRERDRAATLRPGNLMLALRLPRAMWREAHRQALGLWVLAGRTDNQHPRVADLSAFTGAEVDDDEVDHGDIAADVAGALAQDGSRTYRYARRHELPAILSAHAVVPRGARAPRLGVTESAQHLERIHAATLVTAEPLPGFDVLATSRPKSVYVHSRSLGELHDAGQVQVKRSRRIDLGHADPAGTVAVLAADGSTGGVALDPFDARRLYARAAWTEPGDVVFTDKPPRARVDDRGGSVVAAPSRILRLRRAAGIGPHALAAIVNQLPATAREWQAWAVPVLPDTEVDRLEATLARAAGYEDSMRLRMDAVLAVKNALIDGVAAGAVTLRTAPTEGN